MKISIVIPVYNEAERLGACLDAIAAQTVAPFEVIVVDNNSTDDTVAIACRYPFVRLVREPRQGVVHARTTGFNAARGDILGRIDGDSIIALDWVATVQQLFREDHDLAAVSGAVNYYGMALSSAVDVCDLFIRRRIARLMGRDVALQGANLALRRKAWLKVRGDLCNKGDLHEDFDLAIHLVRAGYTNKFDERLRVRLDFQRVNMGWRGFNKYVWLSPQSYSQHHLTSQRHMYPIVIFLSAAYLPLKLLHRSYDPELQRGTMKQLFSAAQPTTVRPNPALFVD
ncbi:MAG: putative glycosyltransferase [Candidatus Saccharibacteria bacterium]|nr:putative glycosyltransferase [Candidatus Saccharibacteria bacterium]